MKKGIDLLSKIIMCVIMIVMILAVCWQVFSRYVLNNPSGITEELLRYLLIWLTMIGAAHAFGQGKHISISFLVGKFSESIQAKIKVVVDLLVILFSVVILIYGGMVTSLNAIGQVSAALRMPMELLYLSLVVAGVLITAHALTNLWSHLKEVKALNSINRS